MRTIASRLTGLAIVVGLLAGCDGDGATGNSALVSLGTEAAGDNCPNGGTAIMSGRDTDGNGALEKSEVESTLYACNGAEGEEGASGEGPAGDDGHSALVVASPEAAGAECPAGGQRIDQGIDANDDGELSEDEIVSTSTVCGGVAGAPGQSGTDSLVNVTPEAAGANCATGGQKVESGVDANDDGQLTGAEIAKTSYFCNGADAEDGLDSLSKVTTEAAGANCAAGGLRIDLGLDDDGDDVLDDAEIDLTNYACNGAAGASSLVDVVDEAAGANCAAGGEKITYGLDADGSGVLDAGEISGTRYVCDGAAGTDGINALVVLTEEDPGATCTYGGQRIDSGRDDDGDDTLDPTEIENTTYVCNGTP